MDDERSTKRGRGVGHHVKTEFTLGPGEQQTGAMATLGTIIVKVYYDVKKPRRARKGDPPPSPRQLTKQEQEAAFAEVVRYCEVHGVVAHRRDTLFGIVYFIRIYQDPLVWKRLKAHIDRQGLVGEKPELPLPAIPPQR